MVYRFLQKQTDRPFLKRYLKRDEILRQISGCDASLSDSVSQFNVCFFVYPTCFIFGLRLMTTRAQISIQIRILKQVQALNSRIETNSQIASGSAISTPPPAYTTPDNALGLSSPTSPSPSTPTPGRITATETPTEIRARLHALRARENERDAGLDIADLRQLMRTALQTSNDVQMIEVLQVGRDEMPEAIKTLQRALEREVQRESASSGSSARGSVLNRGILVEQTEGRRASVPTAIRPTSGLERRKTYASTQSRESETVESGSGGSGDGRARDTLDREFIESGIDALRRVSTGPDMSLPSWTITK